MPCFTVAWPPTLARFCGNQFVPAMGLRVIAVDWSGAQSRAERKIWLAEATEDGRLVRLEIGRSRAVLAQHLIREAAQTPHLVIGLDFAFSFPAWFLTSRGLSTAPALWEIAEREGERWLAECDFPFWGRGGRGRPDLPEHLRRTDQDVPATGGVRPKSVFQVNGAGAVGTGSIRGMPILKQLRDAGFAVWPFDPPQFPTLLEIYPRALTGVVNKGNPTERREYLHRHYPNLAPDVHAAAVGSDDAFDAAVSALVMAAHAHEFASLAPAEDSQRRVEGQIWIPRPSAPPPVRGTRNSSKTRVAPVFQALEARGHEDRQWVSRLLDLAASDDRTERPWHGQDVTVESCYYEPNERHLDPPVALLSWLIRNLPSEARSIQGTDVTSKERRRLASRDPATIERALGLLRRSRSGRGWHILEGPTYPDMVLMTPDALVVVEGKRTEAAPTTSTTWMPGRHQMLRHLDAAWEIRGGRSVYGCFIVEAIPGDGVDVPGVWREAAEATRSDSAIAGSLPHRSPEEQAAIVSGFLGVTTWQAVVARFKLDPAVLLETTDTDGSVYPG